jgi:hypothetical protein
MVFAKTSAENLANVKAHLHDQQKQPKFCKSAQFYIWFFYGSASRQSIEALLFTNHFQIILTVFDTLQIVCDEPKFKNEIAQNYKRDCFYSTCKLIFNNKTKRDFGL